MTIPPPENLMDWPKRRLIAELERYRAIVGEHSAAGADRAPHAGGDSVYTGPGHGEAIIDARGAVLLENMDAMLVDTKQPAQPPAAFVALEGRVNLERRRVRTGYLMPPSAAANIVAELVRLGSSANASPSDEHRRYGRMFDAELSRLIGPPPSTSAD